MYEYLRAEQHTTTYMHLIQIHKSQTTTQVHQEIGDLLINLRAYTLLGHHVRTTSRILTTDVLVISIQSAFSLILSSSERKRLSSFSSTGKSTPPQLKLNPIPTEPRARKILSLSSLKSANDRALSVKKKIMLVNVQDALKLHKPKNRVDILVYTMSTKVSHNTIIG